MIKPGSTNDHLVPVMYLKRFGSQSVSTHVIQAALADSPHVAFSQGVRNVGTAKGFYWGTDPEGVPHHDMEDFLCAIEGQAAPAFRSVLDKGRLPSENALPDKWPPRSDVRSSIAWWIAAQILRTAHQRERLRNLQADSLPLPSGLTRNNQHLSYIAEEIAPLAFLIAARPWGIGVSNLCLFTSDVPVQIINGQHHDDQVEAGSYWDIYLPLDPHRFLYLPGAMHRGQPQLMRDHQIILSGGLTMALNDLMIEYSHRHIFFHPEHDPRLKMNESLIADAVRRRHSSPSESILKYAALPPHMGVERRWLDRHTWDEPTRPSAHPDTENSAVLLDRTLDHLNAAKREFLG